MAEFLKKADTEIIYTVIAQLLDGEKLDQKNLLRDTFALCQPRLVRQFVYMNSNLINARHDLYSAQSTDLKKYMPLPCSLLNCLDVTLLEASSKTNSGRIWCRVYYENDLIGKHMRANRVNIQYPAQ